jgi:hypothetical protein
MWETETRSSPEKSARLLMGPAQVHEPETQWAIWRWCKSKFVGYCGIAHSDNHSITHITIFIMVLKLYSLMSYELRLNCRDLVCVCYWVFPSDDGRGVEQGCYVVKRLLVGRPLAARCVAKRSPAGRQAPGPLRRCLGDVNVSNDVTPFWSIANIISPFGVADELTPSDVQMTITRWCIKLVSLSWCVGSSCFFSMSPSWLYLSWCVLL